MVAPTQGFGGVSLDGANTWTGTQTFSAQARHADGSAGAPSVSFSSNTNLGFYRVSNNKLGVSVASSLRWFWQGSGHFQCQADNTYDIGADGANRPRNGYFGGTLQFGSHSAIAAESVTGYITITDAGGTSRKLAVVS